MHIIRIKDEYTNLSQDDKVKILWRSLDNMEAYNVRSKWTCIAMAMGYDNVTGEVNGWEKVRP